MHDDPQTPMPIVGVARLALACVRTRNVSLFRGPDKGSYGVQFNPSADWIWNCVRPPPSRMQSINIYGASCNVHSFRTERPLKGKLLSPVGSY